MLVITLIFLVNKLKIIRQDMFLYRSILSGQSTFCNSLFFSKALVTDFDKPFSATNVIATATISMHNISNKFTY